MTKSLRRMMADEQAVETVKEVTAGDEMKVTALEAVRQVREAYGI